MITEINNTDNEKERRRMENGKERLKRKRMQMKDDNQRVFKIKRMEGSRSTDTALTNKH